MTHPYRSVDQMVALIAPPYREACGRILKEHEGLFRRVQGSTYNHQAWPGGYYDHVQDAMNIACILYESLSAARPLPFSLSDALLVMFLHDIEKPWKYEKAPDGGIQEIPELRDKDAQHAFRNRKLAEYDVALTPDQQNAMKFVEGEYKEYSNKRRVSGPLAAFCHLCDVTSARIWFDYPSPDGDPWTGARRT